MIAASPLSTYEFSDVPNPFPYVPFSAGPVTVVKGQLVRGTTPVLFGGVNADFSAICGLLNPKAGTMAMDPAQEAVVAAQVANMKRAHFSFCRIHGIDLTYSPIFAAGSTTALDPVKVQALSYFIMLLEQAGISYSLDLHYGRVCVPADAPGTTDPLFLECVSSAFTSQQMGEVLPWAAYPGVLQTLQAQFVTQVLTAVNPYTNVPIGYGPGLVFVGITNERGLTFTATWGYSAHPQLQAAFAADSAAFWASYGITKPGAQEHVQYAIYREAAWLAPMVAVARANSHALIVTSNHFGAGPYSMFANQIAMGDIVDQHCYSYEEATENGLPSWNKFLVDARTTDKRSRFAARIAGGGWGPPQAVTEYGFVTQYRVNGKNLQDPNHERCLGMASGTHAMVVQGVQIAAMYSWMHSEIFSEGSPYGTYNDPYDGRFDEVMCVGVQEQMDKFHNPALRGVAPVVSVPATYGMLGNEQAILGPDTDPALRLIDPACRVSIQ
jgi:hypothetical protein